MLDDVGFLCLRRMFWDDVVPVLTCKVRFFYWYYLVSFLTGFSAAGNWLFQL
jgi:hypothetical protein